jgi:uncharacterized protein YggU (UPF0235/DUF167 family)
MMALPLGTHRLGVRLETRVTPRASRNAVEGIRDGRLVIKVTSPPVDHAANAAVIEVLADALHLPTRALTIVAGEQSRLKSLVVAGLAAPEIRARLSAILDKS